MEIMEINLSEKRKLNLLKENILSIKIIKFIIILKIRKRMIQLLTLWLRLVQGSLHLNMEIEIQ